MKVYIAWDNGGCEKIMIGTYATRKAAEKVIDRFGEIQEMEVQELMKNWSQLFSNKANEMTYLMSDEEYQEFLKEHPEYAKYIKDMDYKRREEVC